MGRVFRPTINFILPADFLLNFVSRGLKVLEDLALPQIEVDIGNGLTFDDQGSLAVDIGNGLTFNEQGSIITDTAVDDSQTSTYKRMIDSTITIDGRRLIMRKTFSDLVIKRNVHGVVVDVSEGPVYEECDDVIFTDYCYCPPGYSGGYSGGYSARFSTPEFPNFYQS